MAVSWFGNMTGPQIVEMGMNIFQLAQKQAQARREQEQENFFRQMQLNMQRERLDLDRARQEAELEFDAKRMVRQEAEAQREQEKFQKLAEYSQGLSEMIPNLDFSDPESMRKLYAYQTKYQPYGVKPEYIKPEIPETTKPMTQKEYGDLVFRVWNGIRDFFETEYKQKAKEYEPPGWFARQFRGAKDVPPELALPTIEDVKKIVDQMIVRGETPETIDTDTLINSIIRQMEPQIQPTPQTPAIPQPTQPQMPLQPQVRTPLGPTAPPLAIPPTPQSPYAGARELLGIFRPVQREYNALSPAEKRIVDRYMTDSGASLEETLQMIKEARAMKAK